MAAVYNSVYYECLQELQRDITNGIAQTDVNVDRLMEKARKKGFILSGHYTRPDSGKLVSRENKIVTLVTRCIDSVKRNGNLFQSFLALLEEAGLQHLVRRIRRRLEDLKPKRGKVPPPSEDSGISTSASSTGQFLPPEEPTTLSSHLSPTDTDNEGVPRQSDQRMSRTRVRQRSKSLPDYGDESELPQQPLTSPIHSGRGPMLPVEETQEDNTGDFVVPDIQPRLLPAEDLKNVVLEERQAQTEREVLQEQTQQLTKDKETLEKELEEKQLEINQLQARHQRVEREKDEHIKCLEQQVSKDKKELQKMRTKTAELERELQQKDRDNEELKRSFSEKEQTIRSQHEHDIKKLKEQLLKEKAKVDKKEIDIKELKNKLLSKELEKQKLINDNQERESTLQKQRDDLKVKLAELHQKIAEEKCRNLQEEKEEEEQKRKAAEQKSEEEESKRKAAEQKREEEESKRKAAEHDRRKSLARIEELEKINLALRALK